jgi:hyaluronate lyase
MTKQKIKKNIALILGIFLLVSHLPMGSLNVQTVSAAEVGVYVNNDFETFNGKVTEKSSFTDSYGNVYWLYNANSDSYFMNKSIDNFRSNSLALVNTNNNNAGIYISKPSVTLKNKLVFESDVYFSDKNLERKVSLKLNSAESDIYEIIFKKDGSITLSNYTNTYKTQAIGTISKDKYETDKWYNVKLIANPATNEVLIYLNNELLDSRVFNERPNSTPVTWNAITECKITQSGNTSAQGGEILVDNFKIYDYEEIQSVDFQDVVINPNESVKLQKNVVPSIADTQLVYISSNTEVVTVDNNGIITAGSELGEATITATSLDGNVQTTFNVKVDTVISVEKITLPESLEVQKGETLDLSELVIFEPVDATNKNIVWFTSDDRKLKVDSNGVLTGINWGYIDITAKTQDGNKIATTRVKVSQLVNSPELDKSEYKNIRDKYFNDLTGGNFDYSDSNTKALVDGIFDEANEYWRSINRDDNRTHIWSDISDEVIDAQGYDQKTADIKKSDAITTAYRRIETMARAYQMQNSPLQGNDQLLNDILESLEWMYNNKYNENLNTEYGNWWNWEIGTPQALVNIGVLMYDELDEGTVKRYMTPIYFYQPDPFNNCFTELNPTNKVYKSTTGANRSDCAKISALLGAIVEDYEQLLMARDAIESLLEYSTLGDGFYEDGSFIQHQDSNGYGAIPYIGSYGYVFLTGIPVVTEILKDSHWEVKEEKLEILKNFVQDSFIPYIYKGVMLDMMRGRSIASYNVTDEDAGKTALNTIMMVARVIDNEDDKRELYSFVKGMIELNTDSDQMESLKELNYRQYPISLANDLKELINGSIIGYVNEDYHKFTSLQDRVVHSRAEYLLGIAMFSKRIANYESMNGENKRGWYTSIGTTYLYNGDLNYYQDFWPTVNPYRMPGTTVDTITMIDGKGNKANLDKDWVGGVQLDNYGANGMEYHQIGSNGLVSVSTGETDRLSLEANKSWFMFDDEIVALGSGISSTDNRTIETIVDNIKLKDDNSNKITINGEEKQFNKVYQNITDNPYPTSDKETIDNVETLFVQGNVDGTSVGYYFPNSTNVNFRNVENTGTWQAIGASGPTVNGEEEEITKNYLEVWIDHGVNPENDTYEYVILPNMTNEEVQAYKEDPKVEILSNTSELQGVKHNELNILAFNNFVDKVQTLEYLTVNTKASVMAQVKNNKLELAISDPTMKNNDGIVVTIDKSKLPITGLREFSIVESGSIEVVEDTENSVTFKVYTSNTMGESIEVDSNVSVNITSVGPSTPLNPSEPEDTMEPGEEPSNSGGGTTDSDKDEVIINSEEIEEDIRDKNEKLPQTGGDMAGIELLAAGFMMIIGIIFIKKQ